MKITIKILRQDTERFLPPEWREYKVDVEPTDRVLDVLHAVKWRSDGTLSLRRSCAHGICGSDAMRINGKNRLACKVLVKDVAPVVTVEPLKGFRVIKDLVVDMEPFFAKYRSIKPFLIADEPPTAPATKAAGKRPPREERRQSPEDRARFDDTTKCILCAACTTSCPSFWADDRYVGPAAIVQAHRFIFDSRDTGAPERLDVLNDGREGVWRCRTVFNCVDACPRHIDVTGAIADVKRALLFKDRS